MELPIQVAVKVRPFLQSDRLHEGACINVLPYENQVVLDQDRCFSVDYALPVTCTQHQLFETAVLPMINYVLQGYDISVIAYGQAGSGKTYTLVGPGLHWAFSEVEYGIIPRAAREIFNSLTQVPGQQFKVKVTFVEVFEQSLHDLLNVSQFPREHNILETANGSTIITGLEEIECQTISEVFNWLHIGMSNRHVGWTAQRQRFNKSHFIFTLSLEQQWYTDGGLQQRFSRAQFTDVAEPEQMCLMGNLGWLSQFVYPSFGFVTYEESVVPNVNNHNWNQSNIPNVQSILPKILKNSFGGTANTLMICCVSPSSLDFKPTLSSLHFAEIVRNLRNMPAMYNYNHNNLFVEDQGIEGVGDAFDSNADTFGLEFAASQWLKLVANAEGLFSKLVTSKYLSGDERDQIEHWLCLKQECEECVGSDDTASAKVVEGRVLERIDELTESEILTNVSAESKYEAEEDEKKGVDDRIDCESETESDLDSQRPDFLDKLDDFIKKFKQRTDANIKSIRDTQNVQEDTEGDVANRNHNISINDGQDEGSDWIDSASRVRSGPLGRRKSIHPGTEMPNLALAFNQISQTSPLEELEHSAEVSQEEDGIKRQIGNVVETESSELTLETVPLVMLPPSQPSPHRELKMLSAGNEARQSEIRQVLIDLDGAHKRIEELQCTIQIKEQFIGDMIKHSDMRASAKQRFQRKRNKLEEEYYKTRTHLAQAENALLFTTKDNDLNTEKLKHRKEIEKYKNMALHYEKRLKDIEIIKQIAGDSARKVLELENSLQTSKRQMEKLKKQLKKEEHHKHCLEQELQEDQRKIKELEQKYNLQTSKLSLQEVGGGMEEERLRWIQGEEEKIVNMRESSQRFKEQLLQQQIMLEKREAFLKEKIFQDKCKTKSMIEVSARISHLEQVLKEKSTDLNKTDDIDEKEALRHEIRNLRKTRDCLVDQRCNLDEKFQKERTLTTVEERKLLECDEAIEAIDAAIEYKNELICGRRGQGLDNNRIQREKGEELLLARLMKLSSMEMRTLLYKYFQKVIDLRESGRKMELQVAELDLQTEAQAWKIQALSNALQQAHLESERRLVMQQKEHQEKLHLMLRHFAEESSGSSGMEGAGRLADPYSELYEYKRENRNLKRRLQEMEALLHTAGRVCLGNRSMSPVTIPQRNLRQLQGPSSPPTTKVTRQKNKLIIQQQKSKPNPKN